MDRATENLLLRVLGSASLALLLVHGGQDLERRPAPWAFVFLWIVIAIAANWALARLNAKRAALWTCLIVLGVIPGAMPLLHVGEMALYDARYMAVLGATGAAGVATALLALMMLARRAEAAPDAG